MNTTADFKVGQRVYFGRQAGEQTLGEVVKVNGTTLKVRQLEARGTMRSYAVGTLWKVPPRLCFLAPASAEASVLPPQSGAYEALVRATKAHELATKVLGEARARYESELAATNAARRAVVS